MKSSEMLREASKDVIVASHTRCICPILTIRFGDAALPIISRIEDYIRPHLFFDIYLARVTGRSHFFTRNNPQELQFIQFLRAKLCLFLAEEFEAKGD